MFGPRLSEHSRHGSRYAKLYLFNYSISFTYLVLASVMLVCAAIVGSAINDALDNTPYLEDMNSFILNFINITPYRNLLANMCNSVEC